MMTIQDTIKHQCERQPATDFLICPDTGETVSMSRLQERVEWVHGLLQARGCQPGDHVAMLMDNGLWTASLLLAIMASGRVAVSLNAIAGDAQLRYVLDHCDATTVIVSPNYEQRLDGLLDGSEKEILVACPRNGPRQQERIASSPLPEVSADDKALLMYTSGTTGKPKGVVLTHANLIAGGKCTMEAHSLCQKDRALCVLPLYHINAQVVTIMAPLISGGSVVLPEKLSVSAFWDWLLDNQCTWFSIVPTIVAYLLEHAEKPESKDLREDPRMRQVRFGRSASSALPAESHRRFETTFGVSLVETMGLTETAAQILSNPLPPFESRYGSPGIAYRNEVSVFDSAGQVRPCHQIGEIVVRGDNVMKEYYKNPEATADTIDSEGWLHTGDLGYRDEEGFFFITGRIKELIIKGGENIAPREIDDALLAHEAVLEAAAYPMENRHYGQVVEAVVVLKEGHRATQEELLDYCREEVGDYKAPEHVHIVKWLPRGPSGKVQRLKIAEMIDHLHQAPA